jgi:hypothetical protein
LGLSDAELKSRLRDEEDNFVERKPERASDREIRKTIVAFANSIQPGETGILFIGVSDDGETLGVSNTDSLQKKVRRIVEDDCYPAIEFTTTAITEADKDIVAVIIGYSTKRPHFAGKAYIRVGSESLEASAAIYNQLIASRNEKTALLQLHIKKSIVLCFESGGGFWFEAGGVLDFCDAHTIRLREDEGIVRSFSVSEIRIHENERGILAITVKPPWTEEEHIRKLVRMWISSRESQTNSLFLNRKNHLVQQLLANPKKVIEAVSAEASNDSGNNIKLLLTSVRFELRKIEVSMSFEQKIEFVRSERQKALAKVMQAGQRPESGSIGERQIYLAEAEAVAQVLTSLEEIPAFFEKVLAGNTVEIREKQRQLVFKKLGLPFL